MKVRNILIFSVCTLLLFTGCFGAKKDSKTNENNIKVNVNETDNISVDYVVVDNNNIVLTVKNNGKEDVDYVSIDLAIYGDKNKLITVQKQQLLSLKAGKENIIKISLIDFMAKEEDFNISKVEIATRTNNLENKVETSHVDSVEGNIEKAEMDGQLNLTITNKSGVVLNNVTAAVVFYKNSKIVDVYITSAQNVSETYTDTVYIPTRSNGESFEYIDYDDVKVVINTASQFIEQ